MNATISSENKKHFPVLLKEIISIISPQYGGTFIDCTFGQGGYSEKILEYTNSCLLYTSPSPRDATLSRMPSSA